LIVVDATILANVVGDDGVDGETARARVADAGSIAAPALVYVEATSVLRKRWIAKSLTERRLRGAIDDMMDLPLQSFPLAPLMHRAFELRSNVSPYDASYVAVAEALSCTLVTADGRLAKATGPRCAIELLTI
jgi:predicted nucleic acid-binding protein